MIPENHAMRISFELSKRGQLFCNSRKVCEKKMYFASSIAENGLTGFSSGTVCVKTAGVLEPEEETECSLIAPVWFFCVVHLLQVRIMIVIQNWMLFMFHHDYFVPTYKKRYDFYEDVY